MSVCVCVRGVSLRPSCVMCAHMCLRERKGGGGGRWLQTERKREREGKGEVADPALFTDQLSKGAI